MSSGISITRDVTDEVHRHTRRIAFKGIGPQPIVGYSYKGKSYLPEFAMATWNHGSAVTEITASGAVIKKDGTPGEQNVSVEYGKSWRSDGAVPEWLAALFADSPHTKPAA